MNTEENSIWGIFEWIIDLFLLIEFGITLITALDDDGYVIRIYKKVKGFTTAD